ncbi:hypothetical protein [uncultured Thermanaerothrix sp.]|uniref:hypothetical protein n=1 Tax=uncultured Thermanaerothrix sp. TaxID=1195149 RepID=UPI002629DB23|nr:hypothetical protein [uncultured Thermanaerothrix sp.]
MAEMKPPFPSFRHGLLGASLLLCLILGLGILRATLGPAPASASGNNLYSPVSSSSTPETTVSTLSPTLTPSPPLSLSKQASGVIVLALSDGPFIHLFAYHPYTLPLTRLTDNPWDDIHPALSPDGQKLAFVSRRNGFWNLYVLSLSDGKLTQMTDSPEYKGHPTWSPDNRWLAYETLVEGNLEILVKSALDPSQPPIRLTEDPALDFSPQWSPRGREILFVSTRSGNEDIWLARLDLVDGRFVNLSQTPSCAERDPAWSPDGRYVVWSGCNEGERSIWIWDGLNPSQNPQRLSSGESPVWSPQGEHILGIFSSPNQSFWVGYNFIEHTLWIPPQPLPGQVYGLTWGSPNTLEALKSYFLPGPSQFAGLLPASTTSSSPPAHLVQLEDVETPYPYLLEEVVPAFNLLRQETARQVGWDLMGNLQSAFLPISEPSGAGHVDDWLYTGRAFALNPLFLQARWMVLTREDYQGATYWRVWLRARYQDGSQGVPLTLPIWNLEARFNGSPQAYEQGGSIEPPPEGYWVDFTELAQRWGWERLPALSNWRSYYPAARFNQYVWRNGLEWDEAMRQVYPAEALDPPTPLPTWTVTPSPTLTPRTYSSPSPTSTATPSTLVLPRPTWTPPPYTRGP